MRAIIAMTNGALEVKNFEPGESYGMIKEAVDGYFDCIRIPSIGVDIWVNDEGKLLELDPNPFGTALWVHEYGMTDMVCGNIIITGGVDEDGETIGLTQEQVDAMFHAVDEVIGKALASK